MKYFVLVLTVLAMWGQTQPAADPAQGGPVALVRFQALSENGKPATGLRPEDIEVREDGKARKVVVLEGGPGPQREIPLEISLVFDCPRVGLSSGALSPRLFHEGLLDEFPNASVAIYGFAPGLSRLAALTRDEAALAKALEAPFLVHPLSTFLMDHISRVMIDSASSPGAAVRIVVIVSTGKTDEGAASATDQEQRFQKAVAIAQESNISAYPVVLMAPLANQDSTPQPPQLQVAGKTPGPQMTMSTGISSATMMRSAGNFASLGSATGGKRIEVPTSGSMLPTVLKWIADEIRSQYVAGFAVSLSGGKKRHKIEIVMRNKDLGRITTGALNLVY